MLACGSGDVTGMCVSGGLAAVIYTDALQTIILVIGCFALTGIGQCSATFDQIIIIITSDNSIYNVCCVYFITCI